jgi:hypothetical protein
VRLELSAGQRHFDLSKEVKGPNQALVRGGSDAAGSLPLSGRALVFLALLLAPILFAAETPADSAAVRKLLADASDIGLPMGAAAPEIRLKDQNGQERNRASLAGPNGLVLVFFRSADW